MSCEHFFWIENPILFSKPDCYFLHLFVCYTPKVISSDLKPFSSRPNQFLYWLIYFLSLVFICQKIGPNVSAQLLEYDKRFSQHGSEFTFYDYNEPEELPMELKHNFQIVVADPPYLVRDNVFAYD